MKKTFAKIADKDTLLDLYQTIKEIEDSKENIENLKIEKMIFFRGLLDLSQSPWDIVRDLYSDSDFEDESDSRPSIFEYIPKETFKKLIDLQKIKELIDDLITDLKEEDPELWKKAEKPRRKFTRF